MFCQGVRSRKERWQKKMISQGGRVKKMKVKVGTLLEGDYVAGELISLGMFSVFRHLLYGTCLLEQYSEVVCQQFLRLGLTLTCFTWLIAAESNDVNSPLLLMPHKFQRYDIMSGQGCTYYYRLTLASVGSHRGCTSHIDIFTSLC